MYRSFLTKHGGSEKLPPHLLIVNITMDNVQSGYKRVQYKMGLQTLSRQHIPNYLVAVARICRAKFAPHGEGMQGKEFKKN